MKKIFTLLASITFIFSLTACVHNNHRYNNGYYGYYDYYDYYDDDYYYGSRVRPLHRNNVAKHKADHNKVHPKNKKHWENKHKNKYTKDHHHRRDHKNNSAKN